MPVTTYMQRHPRHDHGLTIPDPLLTKQFGIPNACEHCHADKGTDWNLKSVEEWYGTNMNRPYRWHAQTAARARQGDEGSVQPLLKMLATDGSFYWRAAAANFLQPWCNEPAVTAGLLAQLRDTNALVRQRVVEALAPVSQAGRSEVMPALQSMLQDSFRNVRVEAARLLSETVDTNSLAGSEYMHFLDNISDQPLGQMQIGAFELQRGDVTNALHHFQTAAKWDPYSAGIREELAVVLSRLGHREEAVNELKKAVELAPGDAEHHYKLALALNEIGDSVGTLAELAVAVRLDPHHARAGYNLGLVRNAAGDPVGAIQALLAAETVDPRDPRIPYARATIYVQLGQISNARAAAHRALQLDSGFTPAALLLRQLN
jgi:Flp pilus assembly protein TadD